MEKSHIKRLVDRIDALPTLPGVVVRILQLAQDDTSDAGAIARVIESDQALTARILRLVNSSNYSFQSEITTVSRAVATLGSNTIRCLALGLGVVQMFPKANSNSGFNTRDFWKHSLGCAVCAKQLAELQPERVDKEEAFVSGLLHDIGKLAFTTCLPEEFAEAVEIAQTQTRPLLQVEQEIFGAHHTQVGKWLAQRWALPDAFIKSIWLHHHPPASLTTASCNPAMIAIVQLADILVRQLMIGSGGDDRFCTPDDVLLETAGVLPEQLKDIQRRLGSCIEEHSAAIDFEFDHTETFLESLQRANIKLSQAYMRVTEQHQLLEQRERRFRALTDMNRKLVPGQTIESVLTVLADTLRDSFGVRTGLCFLADPGAEVLWGKAWRQSGPLADFDVSRSDGDACKWHGIASPDALISKLLLECSLLFKNGVWKAEDRLDTARLGALILIPMICQRKSQGQFLADFREPGAAKSNREHEIDELLAFAGAAGQSISRVRLHETLERHSEQLAMEVWKREQFYKQLLHSERLAAVGEMAAGMAHEVNNPLAIISGRAQMMLQESKEPVQQKTLNLMIDQCSRASKILSDLMAFARPALPKKELASVNTVVYEVSNMLQHRFEKRGIDLQLNLGSDLPKTLIDKAQIQQVLVNLLINADHAIEPPGKVSITTRLSKQGAHVQVAVSDSGCGIPSDQLSRIFEPFFTTKEEGKGTGLGLSLAHGIISSHKGALTVQSKLGEGSTFVVSLPIADEILVSKPEAARREEPAPDTSQRILVVDDEEQMRALISEALGLAGHVVIQAENGIQAMEAIQRVKLDLITLDIRMPRMDGMAVLRAIRERGPKIPVIVITGLASEEEMREAEQLGVVACIRKPFEISRLTELVRKTLNNAAAQSVVK